MADRGRGGGGARLAAFARSLVVLAGVAVGVPWLLVFAARERFGGAAPLHGVPSPADWEADRIGAALTDRLTEQTIADIVIRAALVVAWLGVIVFLLTVIAELVHMVRHDGLAMPDIRGLWLTQRGARAVAAGLLVLVPLVTSPSAALARDTSMALPERTAPVAATIEMPGDLLTDLGADRIGGTHVEDGERIDGGAVAEQRASRPGAYVVRPGDSVFGIAERFAGPDTSSVASFAERLLELNLGRQMPDGRHFNNAAFIDVGWVLDLPAGTAVDGTEVADDLGGPAAMTQAATSHVVEAGESLWSIADDELGDPTRWPEIYDANAGVTFDDGRQLTDPDLIQPGWELDLPDDAEPAGDAVAGDRVDDGIDVVTPVSPLVETDQVTADETGGPDDVAAVPDLLADSLDPQSPINELAATAAPDDPSDGADAKLEDDAAESATSARRDVVWDGIGADAEASLTDAADRSGDAEPAGEAADESPALLALGGAAMLSAGVLALLGVRRRKRLRGAAPRSMLPAPTDQPASTERLLRSIDATERFARVDQAVRAVARDVVAADARVLAVLIGADGALELRSTGPVELAAPWAGADVSWHLAAATPSELLGAPETSMPVPSPTLVQLGVDERGRDVYVDLEALEALEIGGPGVHADAIVAALAATLAGSVLAEVTTLVGHGVPDDAFLGHRLYRPVRDTTSAWQAAADAIGSTGSMSRNTFDLRTAVGASEAWEPAVVLVGASAGTVTPPTVRTGLAVVSAAPIQGPSSRLAPDGDAWQLLPAGIRLTPVGLSPDDIRSIADLVAVPEPQPLPILDHSGLHGEHTIVGADAGALDSPTTPAPIAVLDEPTGPPSDDDAGHESTPADTPSNVPVPGPESESEPAPAAGSARPAPIEHDLLVRLFGQVSVESLSGDDVVFERSKTRELVAWLVTHRERSTRSNARSALWELDVRDATFSNVVSEARRSLARLVEPPEGEEWVGRTMTDSLPLHERVVSDAELVRHALDAARLQPPGQAIDTLRPAVELISGLPFEGTSYLWPDSEGLTSNLVLLATSASAELAAHCLSVGDVEGVFDATSRGLQVLPAHEELIGLRMRAHGSSGDRAGVRQEWESYERVINADPWSDGEPADKLVDLRSELLGGA